MSPWYPACASTSEFDEGPVNFEPAVIGIPYQRGQQRLREAQAFDSVQREAIEFHERKAHKYGIDKPKGLAHLQAARAYREAKGRLQEMFENGGEIGELPPKAIIKANKAAIGFHKKMAEKHGVDSDQGHAHVAAMEHHLDILNKAKQKAKEAQFGHSGKQTPVPVPKKSEQPSEDIRQNKPPVPLQRLQQHEARNRRIANFGKSREGGHLSMGLPCDEPKLPTKQMKKEIVYRGKLPNHVKDRVAETGGQQYVAQRYDKSHPEGFESPEYAGVKKMKTGGPGSGPHGKSDKETLLSRAGRTLKNLNSARDKYPNHHPTVQAAQRAHNKSLRALRSALKSTEARRPSWTGRQRDMHKKMRHMTASVLESNRHDDDEGPSSIDLSSFYKPPERKEGWSGNGAVYSPPRVQQPTQQDGGIAIREF